MITSLPTYWFDKEVTVQPMNTATDSGGGVVTSFTASNYTQMMRFNPGGGSEENTGGGTRTVNQCTLYAPGTCPIIASDRITYGTRVFDVKNVSDADEMGVLLKITAVEVFAV